MNTSNTWCKINCPMTDVYFWAEENSTTQGSQLTNNNDSKHCQLTGDRFGALWDCMFGKFTREDEADSSLNLSWRNCWFLGVGREFYHIIRVRSESQKTKHATHWKLPLQYAQRYHSQTNSKWPSPCWRYPYQGALASTLAPRHKMSAMLGYEKLYGNLPL